MIRLLRTEFRRFWARRLVWISAGIAFSLILIAFVLVFLNSEAGLPTNESAVREAQVQTERCLSDFADSSVEDLRRDFGLEFLNDAEVREWVEETLCFQDPAWYGAQDKRFFATELLTEDYQVRNITDWSQQRPDFGQPEYGQANFNGSSNETYREARGGLVGILPAVATFSLVLAVLIGASFVGAEYKSGTVENLLLWEPRRGRVLSAKFVAGFISSAALTMIVLSWLVALFVLLANLRGSTQGVDSRFWVDVFSISGRAALIGGLFFIMAMSVAVIARNTTASVGLILGWFAISNIVIELTAKGFRQYEIFVNALSFISEANVPKYEVFGRDEFIVYSHSYLAGGGFVLVWAAVLATIAVAVFVRRDID